MLTSYLHEFFFNTNIIHLKQTIFDKVMDMGVLHSFVLEPISDCSITQVFTPEN